MLDEILKQVELITNWENEYDWQNKPWYSDLLAKNTCTLYESYKKRVFADEFATEVIEVDLSNYNQGYKIDDDYWKRVDNLIKTIKDRLSIYCSNIILTGSLADRKVVQGWSDFDCVLGLRLSTINNFNNLKDFVNIVRTFKRDFKKIDPLAHHAFFIRTECELNAKSVSSLPVGLFENASSLHGLRKLQIRKKIQQKIDKEPLMREASFLQSTLDEGIMSHHSRAGMPLTFPLKYNSSQMYQLKYLVGRILLLPCSYAASKGVYLGKRSAFEFLYSEIPNLDEMQYFEEIRKEYPKYQPSDYYQYIPKEIVSSEFQRNLGNLIRKIAE